MKILDWHEVVNDQVGGAPLAVTYCPLCDSTAVFSRDEALEFGVSGLLYNSNVLMFDRGKPGKESLWSQLAGAGVTGDKNGSKLDLLPMEVTTWGDWRNRHPETKVLSSETGHSRRYKSRPYLQGIDDQLSVSAQRRRQAATGSLRGRRLHGRGPALGKKKGQLKKKQLGQVTCKRRANK